MFQNKMISLYQETNVQFDVITALYLIRLTHFLEGTSIYFNALQQSPHLKEKIKRLIQTQYFFINLCVLPLTLNKTSLVETLHTQHSLSFVKYFTHSFYSNADVRCVVGML